MQSTSTSRHQQLLFKGLLFLIPINFVVCMRTHVQATNREFMLSLSAAVFSLMKVEDLLESSPSVP